MCCVLVFLCVCVCVCCVHVCVCVCVCVYVCVRAEANTRFAWIFARLHNYSNAMKVFGCTTNDFGVVILDI